MKLKPILHEVWYDEIRAELKRYQDATFSSKPGIYLVGYTGSSFPLGDIGPDQVVYIGKTEESQKARDVETHFATGKTGQSTLRRSVGAMLRAELGLIAVPRNGKTSPQAIRCYEFAGEGEDRVTDWVRRKLSVAFKPAAEMPGDLAEIEKAMIRYRCPILNLQNNPRRDSQLQALRKICREEAKQVALNGSTS